MPATEVLAGAQSGGNVVIIPGIKYLVTIGIEGSVIHAIDVLVAEDLRQVNWLLGVHIHLPELTRSTFPALVTDACSRNTVPIPEAVVLAVQFRTRVADPTGITLARAILTDSVSRTIVEANAILFGAITSKPPPKFAEAVSLRHIAVSVAVALVGATHALVTHLATPALGTNTSGARTFSVTGASVGTEILAAVVAGKGGETLAAAVDTVAATPATVGARVLRTIETSPSEIADTGVSVADTVAGAVVGAVGVGVAIVASLAVRTDTLSPNAGSAAVTVVGAR